MIDRSIQLRDLGKVPNLLTLLRLLLTIPIILTIYWLMWGYALLLLWTAAATDLLDGIAARRLKQQSPLGEVFDLTVDRFVMTPSIVAAFFTGYFDAIGGMWMAAAFALPIISGDVTILYGIYRYIPMKLRFPALTYPSPPKVAKWTFFFQLVGVSAVLASGVLLQTVISALIVPYLLFCAAITGVAGYVFMKKAHWIFFGRPEDHLATAD